MLDPLKMRMNMNLFTLLVVIIKVICTMKKGVILARHYADYKIFWLKHVHQNLNLKIKF